MLILLLWVGVLLIDQTIAAAVETIDGVMMSHSGNEVLEASITSALKNLIDVKDIYIISEDNTLQERFGQVFGPRVIFIDESIFPFNVSWIQNLMISTVKLRKPEYGPLDGYSPLEQLLRGHKVNWYKQQVIKLYAGDFLSLNDYVVFDGDIVWHKPVKFIHELRDPLNIYNYVPSNQKNSAYYSTISQITKGYISIKPHSKSDYSGISHHMVFAKVVVDEMKRTVQELHGLPLSDVMIIESAIELTCKRLGRSGGSESVLSEYELYFHFARKKFPDSLNIRNLIWANGPMQGLVFIAYDVDFMTEESKSRYEPGRFEDQLQMDALKGYDYVAYHSYAKRRYFEWPPDAVMEFCGSTLVYPNNISSCSYSGLKESGEPPSDWFANCICHNVM